MPKLIFQSWLIVKDNQIRVAYQTTEGEFYLTEKNNGPIVEITQEEFLNLFK